MMGKTVVITGATSGIGKAAAVRLAVLGADVVMLARSEERAQRAEGEIRDEIRRIAAEAEMKRARAAASATGGSPDDLKTGLAAAYAAARQPPAPVFPEQPVSPGTIRHILCDLASLESVRQAATAVLAECPRIDVLVNNAGVFPVRRSLTADGHERAFGVNHLGHFLLTMLLLPRIVESAPSRIVMVASSVHRAARIRFDDISLEHAFRPMRAYGQSKLATVMFARELARRLEGTGVTVNAIHPGTVASSIGAPDRDKPHVARRVLHAVLWPVFRTPDRGAAGIVRLAAGPDGALLTGRYFHDRKERTPGRDALDNEITHRLWKLSEDMTGLPQRFRVG